MCALISASHFYGVRVTGTQLVHGLRAPPVVACREVKRVFALQKGISEAVARDLCTIARRLVKQHIATCKKLGNSVGVNITS